MSRALRRSGRLLRALLAALGWAATASACAGSRSLEVAPPSAAYADTAPIREPRVRVVSEAYDLFENNFADPIARLLDLPDHVSRAAGRPREAANLDAWDDVEDSSWFEHRNAHRRLSLEEIARGPNRGAGPDTSRPWIVLSGSAAGITPKFTIRDARGDRYIIKFDPPGYPELASGAEVISTKLFYAAGYHTPENHVVVFDPARLVVDRESTVDVDGEERAMTSDDVASLLARAARRPDGRVRALASKFLRGKPKGAWNYEGRRADDPNDRYKHQHRRELRGLFVLAAWLNHEDVRQGNTLDVFIGEDGRGYLRHYLIDFGSTLGSGATQPHTAVDGSAYFFDLGNMALRGITLGLYRASWEGLDDRPVRPAIGYLRAEGFDPRAWKPTYPNPAFAERTARDVYWGTKLVASFTDDHIRAAVEAAEFSDLVAESLMVFTLIARRDRVIEYGLRLVTPLEEPELSYDSAGRLHLRFEDLALVHGLVQPEGRVYRARFRHPGLGVDEQVGRGAVVSANRGEIELDRFPMPDELPADPRSRIATVEIVATDPESSGSSRRPARVYLLLDAASRRYRVAGLAH